MTLDELRAAVKAICDDAVKSDPSDSRYSQEHIQLWGLPDEKRKAAREKVQALFREYRSQFFQIAKVPEPVGDWWDPWTSEQMEVYNRHCKGMEKEIKDLDPGLHRFLQTKAIAFFTCSCGSREDSCSEDVDGNFSRFIFTVDGNVFRSVEKKP